MNGQWECHSFDLNQIKLRCQLRDEGSGSGCELFTGCFYRLLPACRLCAHFVVPSARSRAPQALGQMLLFCVQINWTVSMGANMIEERVTWKKSLNIQINMMYGSFIELFVKNSVFVVESRKLSGHFLYLFGWVYWIWTQPVWPLRIKPSHWCKIIKTWDYKE